MKPAPDDIAAALSTLRRLMRDEHPDALYATIEMCRDDRTTMRFLMRGDIGSGPGSTRRFDTDEDGAWHEMG